jgi:hypothetical protein
LNEEDYALKGKDGGWGNWHLSLLLSASAIHPDCHIGRIYVRKSKFKKIKRRKNAINIR